MTSFLKKLSCYAINKEEMKTMNVADKLAPHLTTENPGKIICLRLGCWNPYHFLCLLCISIWIVSDMIWLLQFETKLLYILTRFDQFRGTALTQPVFWYGPPGKHDQGRNAPETGQPDDGSESPESSLLRPLSSQSGGQGEEHVHLHGLHPHRHEDDPWLMRGTGWPRGHGLGH